MVVNYQPVVRAVSEGAHGAALVGTHSAIIGWTLDDAADRKGLLGYAIRRTDFDPADDEVMRLTWLGGYKRFVETDDGKVEDVSSLDGPFQRFRWNDYTLSTSRWYRYEVFPMRGAPTAMTRDEPPLTFDVRPSAEDPGDGPDDLGVFVNRGVTAAAAYLKRFKNQTPAEVGPAAYRWLSRGLKESLLDFIAATPKNEALHVAIYEFFDDEVAGAFRAAIDRGVDVHIVHDAKPGKHSTEKSEAVVERFNLQGHRTKRTTVNISHNKLVIRLDKKGVPTAAWTGSANFSENAFNFQTNTGLIVRDRDAVQHFEDFFQILKGNPSKKDSKLANRLIVDRADLIDPRFAHQTFFSPLSSNDILDCSVELIKSAKSALLISAPFGVDKSMIEALHANSTAIIEYGLVNTTAKRKIETLQTKNSRFYPPNRLETYLGKSWDAKAFGAHKIHAKTIVVDPWGDDPKVLIGSANFSKPSCRDNDENAVLITGNPRLAAIIGTEFMRMYDHYKSRFFIQRGGAIPTHLVSGDGWSRTAFDPKSSSHKFQDRIVFAGD